MADNIQTGNFAGQAVTVRTTEAGGVHTPHHLDPAVLEAVQALEIAILGMAPGGSSGGDASAANQAAQSALLTEIRDKLIAAPATQATLASVLAKLTSDPATQTTLAAVLTAITAQAAYLDGIEGGNASILAKLIAAPATEAKQDALVSALNLLAPASGAIAVTPSDTTTLANVRSLKIGGAGTVVATIGGNDFTFTCSAGEMLPIRATKVKAASTATNIVALT